MLFQVKFISLPLEVKFLALGICVMSHEIPASRISDQGIKELFLMSQFRPTEGGNGGRGRLLTPAFSGPHPQWGH